MLVVVQNFIIVLKKTALVISFSRRFHRWRYCAKKGRARVSKLFYAINFDARQSRQANDSASIIMHAIEKDFATEKC